MSMVEDALSGLAKGAAAGSIVPGMGTVIGGLTGLATSLVPHIFGDDAKPALAAAARAITGADDEAGQVQVLSTDSAALAAYKVQALKIAGDREQAQLDAQTDRITASYADTQDARATTVDLAKTGSSISWGAPVISITIVVGIFVAFGALLWRQHIEDAGVSAMVNMIVGAFVLAFGQVARYWLGGQQQEAIGAASSARKTELLGRSVPTLALPKPLAVVPASDVK